MELHYSKCPFLLIEFIFLHCKNSPVYVLFKQLAPIVCRKDYIVKPTPLTFYVQFFTQGFIKLFLLVFHCKCYNVCEKPMHY